jgi:PTS system nitrogen regulatory IIA component
MNRSAVRIRPLAPIIFIMPHRLLSTDELADYLHVTRKVVEQWALRKEIPWEKVGDRYVFRKVEIDAWASRRLLSGDDKQLTEFHHASTVAKKHDLSETHAIMPELIQTSYIDMELASKTKASALRSMVALASESGQLLETVDLLDSIEERERQCSTALGGGVALLHPQQHDPYMFADSFIVLGRTHRPIPFGSPDGRTTDLFFLICCQDDAIHLHVLARICMMCHHTSLLMELREAETAEDAYQALLAAEEEVIKKKIKE